MQQVVGIVVDEELTSSCIICLVTGLSHGKFNAKTTLHMPFYIQTLDRYACLISFLMTVADVLGGTVEISCNEMGLGELTIYRTTR